MQVERNLFALPLPHLADIHRRNAHIVYSAQSDYRGLASHRNPVWMLDADDAGNLYRVGTIKLIWVYIMAFCTNGKNLDAINTRVASAFGRTLDAINTHFETLDDFATHLGLGFRRKLEAFCRELYVSPKSDFRVEKVQYEALFFLNPETIQYEAYHEPIYNSRPLVHPFRSIANYAEKMETMRRKFAVLDTKICDIYPVEGMVKFLNLDENGTHASMLAEYKRPTSGFEALEDSLR